MFIPFSGLFYQAGLIDFVRLIFFEKEVKSTFVYVYVHMNINMNVNVNVSDADK
jgi:hypothetical protein